MQKVDVIEALYALYEQKMYYEAYRVLRDEYLAEDAVQEAFLRLIRNRDKLGDCDSLRVRRYVYKTVRCAALDIYRKQKKNRENFCEWDERAEKVCFEESLDTNTLLSVLNELPQKYFFVIKCLFFDGLTAKETAAVLKISEACVRKRCERARKLLKEKINF